MKHSSMLFFALTICACSSANQDDPDPILIVEHDMGIGSTDTSQRPIDDVLVVVDDCQPSEGTPFEMPADGLDATWLGDEIVLSFVDASSEQEGTVKVEKRSVEGELLASARSLTTRVSGPGGGAYPWNFSTAIHTLNNHVGLAFHTQVENADGKGSNVLFQMLADDLTPVTNASIMNDTRWSDYNVDAYVPKITSRNDEFLIFWSDYRMNQPRVSGQNFFLHGTYASQVSVDGTRSLFDQQIVQGTGRPWTNVALDSNAQLWAWGSRIDDESTLVFSQFPGDDEYTVQESLKAPAAIEHVAMDDTRIAWARDGATLKLADVATMSSEQTIDQSDEQDARFRVHLSDDTLVYVLTTRDRTTLNGVLLDGLNESQRWEPIDFGFERFIRVLDTRRNGDQVDVLLHVWNDRESSVEQRTFCFN